MNYIGAYVLEVPTTSKDAYRDLAEQMVVGFKKNGAMHDERYSKIFDANAGFLMIFRQFLKHSC